MKIVRESYYDKVKMRDTAICDNVSEFYGRRIVRFLNSEINFYSTFKYELVRDDYVLFVPELKEVAKNERY